MIKLASIIKTFGSDLLRKYQDKLLPSHKNALWAMKTCRTNQSPKMLTSCVKCEEQQYVPHSCGHRNCPNCQNHESQQWLERQLKKQVPADYFLVTFTLPKQLRSLAWQHQRQLYTLMLQCSWDTLNTFCQNDKELQGTGGAISVLHTHSRRLDYHPHIHVVIPAAAIDKKTRLWRVKKSKNNKAFLFNHKALAKVFRAKMLEAITQAGLVLPAKYPSKWIVDCKAVGAGDKALIYLGRYLYRGVVKEKDIVSCKDGKVTFRYVDSETKKTKFRKLAGADFLWLLLRHVLPKGFRRARNFGFLHPNSKRLLQVLHLVLKFNPGRALAWMRKRPSMVCSCCGGKMEIIKTRILPIYANIKLVDT
jgi:hypothetical protein